MTPATTKEQRAQKQQGDGAGDERALLDTLSLMEPIGLAEMDSVRLMNRVDSKFVLGEATFLKLLNAVRSDYRVLHVDGAAVSPYATLYFDTADRDCYRQHHNGKLNRHKYRVRTYLSSGARFLEVKTKNNRGRTDKNRVELRGSQGESSADVSDAVRSIAGHAPALEPCLWTRFSRVTLVDHDLSERVTFDRGLEFNDTRQTRRLPGVVIAEVKQESDDRMSPVREQLRRLAVRPLRVSKYCLGSLLLEPGLKQNRFKSKLLALQKIV